MADEYYKPIYTMQMMQNVPIKYWHSNYGISHFNQRYSKEFRLIRDPKKMNFAEPINESSETNMTREITELQWEVNRTLRCMYAKCPVTNDEYIIYESGEHSTIHRLFLNGVENRGTFEGLKKKVEEVRRERIHTLDTARAAEKAKRNELVEFLKRIASPEMSKSFLSVPQWKEARALIEKYDNNEG